jgi:hypothetical protein
MCQCRQVLHLNIHAGHTLQRQTALPCARPQEVWQDAEGLQAGRMQNAKGSELSQPICSRCPPHWYLLPRGFCHQQEHPTGVCPSGGPANGSTTPWGAPVPHLAACSAGAGCQPPAAAGMHTIAQLLTLPQLAKMCASRRCNRAPHTGTAVVQLGHPHVTRVWALKPGGTCSPLHSASAGGS